MRHKCWIWLSLLLCSIALLTSCSFNEKETLIDDVVSEPPTRDTVMEPEESKAISFDFIGGKDVMPLGAYYGPHLYNVCWDGNETPQLITEEQFQLAAELGINLFVKCEIEMKDFDKTIYDILRLGEKYGIGIMPTDKTLNARGDAMLTPTEFGKRVSAFRDYDAWAAVYLVDEPSTSYWYSDRVDTINFPLYSNVKKLYVGLHAQALIEQAPDYKCKAKVVYYGSSITQGGCASRPGNSYQAIISRLLDCDYVNLGFSGNAMGEDAITDYISALDMQCFVMDYDHNAPSVEHLENTHERMFQKIREKNPKLPIVIVTRPKAHLNDEEILRLTVIERTYQNAVIAGDKNVYFIKGCDLIAPELAEVATVDGVHPNDSGFVSMAYGLCKVLSSLLKKSI